MKLLEHVLPSECGYRPVSLFHMEFSSEQQFSYVAHTDSLNLFLLILDENNFHIAKLNICPYTTRYFEIYPKLKTKHGSIRHGYSIMVNQEIKNDLVHIHSITSSVQIPNFKQNYHIYKINDNILCVSKYSHNSIKAVYDETELVKNVPITEIDNIHQYSNIQILVVN